MTSPAAPGDPPGSPAPAASGLGWARIARVVAALFAVQLATALLPFGLGALAPLLRARFGLTLGQVGLATTAVFVSVALMSIPMGRVADRVGVAVSMILAAALVALAMAGVAVAGGYGWLLIALALGGAGYAVVTPATNKGILDSVPQTVRGRAMGVKQMGVTAGGVVAAAALPASILSHGWSRTLLATSAAIALIGLAGAWAYRSLTGGRRPEDAAPSARRDGALRRLLRLGSVVGVLIGAQFAVATYLTLFIVDERRGSVAAAAAALTILHASGTAARLGWGYMSDRLPGGRVSTIGLIGASSSLALVALATVGAQLPWPAMLVLVMLLGSSTQGGNAVYQTALVEEDERRAGRASGIGMSLGFAGAIVLPPLFGAAVDATGSYTLPFLSVAIAVGSVSLAVLGLQERSP